jgi:hypothetical protein
MVPFRLSMSRNPSGPGPFNFAFVTVVPGSPDEQDALIHIVDEALEGLPGPWKVGVCRGTVVSWIILSIFRDDGFECSLFLDEPAKQTPLFVRDQVASALQLHALGRTPWDVGPVKDSLS